MARNVLGLLASAIACFSIGVLLFEVQCISFCDWSWICLRAYRSYARFYERTKVFFWLLLRSIFHKNLSGGTVTFYPAACFPLDPFLAQVFEAWIRLSVHSLMHEACALRRRLMAYTTINKAVPHVKAYLWPWKERRSTSSCNQKHGVYPWPWFPAELFVVTIASVP